MDSRQSSEVRLSPYDGRLLFNYLETPRADLDEIHEVLDSKNFDYDHVNIYDIITPELRIHETGAMLVGVVAKKAYFESH